VYYYTTTATICQAFFQNKTKNFSHVFRMPDKTEKTKNTVHSGEEIRCFCGFET